jgi:toxin ParE1/3/4
MPKCVLDPCVENELWEIWRFIAQDNPDAADRVLEVACKTFEILAKNPGIGRPRRFRKSRLRNLRSRQVSGFNSYLVFYAPIADGIEVFHVLHGARDLERLWESQ